MHQKMTEHSWQYNNEDLHGMEATLERISGVRGMVIGCFLEHDSMKILGMSSRKIFNQPVSQGFCGLRLAA
jgi:hypothetical protein